MAIEAQEPLVPVPSTGDWRLESEQEDIWLEEQLAVTRNLDVELGEITGAILRWQRADGYAWYLVINDEPLTLQHVDLFDGYTVEPALIRGLDRSDVERMIRQEQAFARLMESRRVHVTGDQA